MWGLNPKRCLASLPHLIPSDVMKDSSVGMDSTVEQICKMMGEPRNYGKLLLQTYTSISME